jgi:hypothetical protein
VAGAKEPFIAGRAAIRVLKQHMVKEPIYEAVSSRSVELFAAARGTPRRSLSIGSGFVHGKNPLLGMALRGLAALDKKQRHLILIRP